MTIQVTPETEAMLKSGLQSGLFQSAEEFVDHAVRELYERETWMAADKQRIDAQIEAGIASIERGDLLTPEQAAERMRLFKANWRQQRARL